MATHLRIQEERSLLMENHTHMVETNGRQSGIGSRRFSYSDHLADKTTEIKLGIFCKKNADQESEA
jgi:hypothetical protein